MEKFIQIGEEFYSLDFLARVAVKDGKMRAWFVGEQNYVSFDVGDPAAIAILKLMPERRPPVLKDPKDPGVTVMGRHKKDEDEDD